MKILEAIIILLGGGERAESVKVEIKGENVQVLRYNNNDNDMAIAYKGKVIHTTLKDVGEEIQKAISQ